MPTVYAFNVAKERPVLVESENLVAAEMLCLERLWSVTSIS